MKTYIIKIFSDLKKWFSSLTSKPEPAKKKRKSKKNTLLEDVNTEMSQFQTLGALMDTLDRVFLEMESMKVKSTISKKVENSINKLILSYGAYIFSLQENSNDKISCAGFESLAYGYPSFIINFNRGDRSERKDGDENLNYFFTATKEDRPLFQPKKPDHIYYLISMVFADPDRKLKGFHGESIDYFIEVDLKTNKASALKHPVKTTKGMTKKKHRNGNFNNWYGQKIYQYPDIIDYQEVKKFKNYSKSDDYELYKKNHLEKIFYINFNMTMRREFNININVTKNGRHCSFSVPENQWKHFFKGRQKVKTINGHTKPIFHCVSSHLRIVKGQERAVKTHYRGVRHFFWNSYEIKITMPGKHSASKSELNATATTEDIQDSVDITDQCVADKINKIFGY